MVATHPRITARVDEETKALLLKAAKLIGQPSINAFVLNSAVARAKEIVEREQILDLSERDFRLLLDALDGSSKNESLQKAHQKYQAKNENRPS